MIIYDNACNFHHYVASREPEYFAKTALFIDRMHMYVLCTICLA